MPPIQSLILGPELFWLLICALIYGLCLRNNPPTDGGSAALEKWWYIVPLLFLPAGFLLYFVPTGANPWWLLLRLDLAAAVGVIATAVFVANAIDYQTDPTRNSGVLAGMMIAVVFAVFTGGATNVVTIIALLITSRRGAP